MIGPENVGARQLMKALGNCFHKLGWEDDGDLALTIVLKAREAGSLDPEAAAALASTSDLARYKIDRPRLEAAISEVFTGRILLPAELDYPSVVNQTTNTFQISGDSNVIIGDVNVGGQQFNLTNESAKDDVLGAVRALVADAFVSGLSQPALTALDQFIDARGDLEPAEIEAVAREVITEAELEPGKLIQFRNAVGANVASGLLVHALIAATAAIS